MKSIENFLNLINENWTTIMVIISLVSGILVKLNNYLKLTNEQKINQAIEQIKNITLSLVIEAEKQYGSKTGEFKKSYVLSEIYKRYPILVNILTKENLNDKIDKIVEDGVNTLKDKLI